LPLIETPRTGRLYRRLDAGAPRQTPVDAEPFPPSPSVELPTLEEIERLKITDPKKAKQYLKLRKQLTIHGFGYKK
jgi:hypothetical protein